MVNISRPEILSSGGGEKIYRAEVLVLGGGPAGTWAAASAASQGASVILADKGFCGTSGATAPSGTGVWYIDPDPAKREAAMASREAMGGYLQDRKWMSRVLDRTYDNISQLAAWGYPFPVDGDGRSRRNSLQGPEYMRLMRKRVKQAGAKILDHSPALELLVDSDGAVSGASGLHRQTGERWTIHAGAVVIATGGCAFLSGALGCNVLTGDGYLMAAETGAELSGMEFSNAYAMSTEYGSVTKTLFYNWATFTHEDGRPVEGAKSKGGRSIIAKELDRGRVFAQLDKADEQTRASMRLAQPNFFLPLDRAGIDPFSQRFPITLRLEGTVRGTGGLRIVDETCATTVPGLYAAGDAATRELICGAFTGGGSHNCAWAMSSGAWAGEAAGQFARQRDARDTQGAKRAGDIGLRDRMARPLDASQLTKDVQAEVIPYKRNYFRNAERLESSLSRLDTLWDDAAKAGAADIANVVKTREAAAMLASARWMYRSASARTESRGMARRMDHPQLDKNMRRSIHTGGLREVWTRQGPVAPESVVEAAE